MKKLLLSFALSVSTVFMLYADDVSVADSNVLTASLDTIGSVHAITSIADAVTLVCRPGSMVTAADADSGETRTLTASASGSVSWMPTAGGLWTLYSSLDGQAEFTVRYSLFGAQGTGSVSDPFKIVDGEELADMADAGTMTDGCYLTLRGASGLMGELFMPSGYALLELDSGDFRFAAASGGLVYCGTPVTSFIDAKNTGPDRKMKRNKGSRRIAYSGDNWCGDPASDATLTLVSPSGVETDMALSGTGSVEFDPDEIGLWSVILSYDTVMLTSSVTVCPKGMSIIIR